MPGPTLVNMLCEASQSWTVSRNSLCAVVCKVADMENPRLPPLREHSSLNDFMVYGYDISDIVRQGGRFRAVSTRITVNQQSYLECMESAITTWCALCEAGAWAMYQ